jgi:dihydrofolate reductase
VSRPTAVVYIARSLDGFIARPDGAIDWLGEPDVEGGGGGEDYGWSEFIAGIDTIVMGRATFEQVLSFGAWPYEGTPLVVLSSTRQSVPENLRGKAEVSALDPAAVLDQLAGRGCERVYIDGGKTIQSFLRADLIDELILTTLPVLIGQGLPLFGSLDTDMNWEHVATRTYATLVQSHYRRRLDR